MPLPTEFVPFPTDLIPFPCGDYCAEYARAIGCDSSMVALPFLVSVASAIGNTRTIALKSSWHEPSILWAAVVSPSGTHKTPAMKAALKVFRSCESALFDRNRAAETAREAALLEYEKKVAQWKKSSSGSPPPKPEHVGSLRYIVSDITTEALAGILRDNPRGLLLVRDELSGWFGSFDRYAKGGTGGGDSAAWLSMNNAETLVIDRKTGTHPQLRIPRASVSIFGGIQPGILDRLLTPSNIESGMHARFLLVQPPPRVSLWSDDEPKPASERAVERIFTNLLSLRPIDGHNGPEPYALPLNPDAREQWRIYKNSASSEMLDLPDELKACASKMIAYTARLALIVHALRASNGEPEMDDLVVDETSMLSGIALGKWFWNETQRIHAIRSETDQAKRERVLVEFISMKGGEVSVRDITHGIRAYRGDTDAAELMVAWLVENKRGEWVERTPNQVLGNPARKFRLIQSQQESA